MKRICLALTICLFTYINFAHAQSAWTIYKIDDKLSIKTPPERKIVSGNIYALGKDSSVYIITVIDMVKVGQIDAATLAKRAPTQEFADEIRTGMLSTMPNFTLSNIKVSKWKNYTCYTVDGGNQQRKLKVYAFMVVIDNDIYSLMSLVSEKNSTQGKDDFFASLMLN